MTNLKWEMENGVELEIQIGANYNEAPDQEIPPKEICGWTVRNSKN
jgi:hypothetical protein